MNVHVIHKKNKFAKNGSSASILKTSVNGISVIYCVCISDLVLFGYDDLRIENNINY